MLHLFSHSISLLLLLSLPTPIHSTLHPAKRQQTPQTIRDICGRDAVDCGNGWCCFGSQECVAARPEPYCLDKLFTTGYATLPAFPFRSQLSEFSRLNSEIASLDSELRTLGITLPTSFPTTLTGRITALPTYTDNVLPSSYSETVRSAERSRIGVVGSTGGAVPVQTGVGVVGVGVGMGVLVGGIVGWGI